MSRIKKIMKKRRKIDEVDHGLDSKSFLVNKHDYVINGIFPGWHVNDNEYLVQKKYINIGIFKSSKNRVQ